MKFSNRQVTGAVLKALREPDTVTAADIAGVHEIDPMEAESLLAIVKREIRYRAVTPNRADQRRAAMKARSTVVRLDPRRR